MRIDLRPVGEQVMVITGADSGIGLATARAAAGRGARLVLNSRNAAALAQIAAELRATGAEVAWHAGDVGDETAMRDLARTAVETFGRIDTWVNNAGVSVYGEIERVPLEDARRLFQTNYWGVVHGSLAALPYLKRSGGALVNVGSVVSGVAVPLQGHYTASKHAVKGFTDSLRQELLHQEAPVAVTLIRPAAIDTPYTEHARNLMSDAEPNLPPPIYAPSVVARAILDCAERPQREVLVGGAGKQMEMMQGMSPAAFDRYATGVAWEQQRAPRGSKRRNDALYAPSVSGRERGDYDGHVMRTSAYTAVSQHKLRSALVLGLVGAGALWLARSGLLDQIDDTLRARFGLGGGTPAEDGVETMPPVGAATRTVPEDHWAPGTMPVEAPLPGEPRFEPAASADYPR